MLKTFPINFTENYQNNVVILHKNFTVLFMAYVWCAVRVISVLCGKAAARYEEGKEELDGRW